MSLLSRLLRRWGYVKLADYGLQLSDGRVVPLAPGLSPGQGAPPPQGALPPGPPPGPGPVPPGAPWPGHAPGAPEWQAPVAPAPWQQGAPPPNGAAPWPQDGAPQPPAAPAPGPSAPPPHAGAPSPSPTSLPPLHAQGPLPPVPSAEITPHENLALADPNFEDTMSFLTVDGEEPARRDRAQSDSGVGPMPAASARPAPAPSPRSAPLPKPSRSAPRPAPTPSAKGSPVTAGAISSPSPLSGHPAPASAQPAPASAQPAPASAPPRSETDAEATRAARPSRLSPDALAASRGEVGARLADDSDDATILESIPAGAHFFAAPTAARAPAPRQIPTVIADDALASGTPLPPAGAPADEPAATDDTDVSRRGE